MITVLRSRLIRIVIWLLALGLIGAALLTAVGVRRYGDLNGVVRRLEVEIAALRPKPELAPTLVPIATIDAAEFAASLNLSDPVTDSVQAGVTESPSPTLRPTWTPLASPSSATQNQIDVEPLEGDDGAAQGDMEMESVEVEVISPTPTSLPTLTPEPSSTPIFRPAVREVYLDTYRHEWQDWNNCGPATLSTYLSFHGIFIGQEVTAPVLKPNEKDKNVNPEEIVAFVAERYPDLHVHHLYNGDINRLKLLLSNEIPVMLVTWLEESRNDGMGHYRFLVGYDEGAGEWIVSDSFVSEGLEGPYEGIRIPNAEFNRLWSIQDRGYILIYADEKRDIAEAIVGADLDRDVMLGRAIAQYQSEIQSDAGNPFAWHTLGELLMEVERPAEAAQAYDQARTIGLPWRMFWYNFQIYEAYFLTGRHQDVVDLADATIESGGAGEEVYYWKGKAHMALGETAKAENAFYNALWWYPDHPDTRAALRELYQN